MGWLNFQPDAPYNVWPPVRDDVLRLQARSGPRVPVMEPVTSIPSVLGALPSLPQGEIRTALEQVVTAVAAAAPSPLTLSEAQNAVGLRMKANIPMVVHAEAIALALEHDAAFCSLP